MSYVAMKLRYSDIGFSQFSYGEELSVNNMSRSFTVL